ncbi:hypothetical protein ATJ97_1310 [Georgenia soli]|uniref:DUF2231 domain-containing protein n=1 Tax=Georgenia soli TaxID=638953 RepID=A0A2A9EKN6_9MICO|nr:DUF2231 domain-containing protein [Georgenia soli]PFG38822.1 hypothetical protein ATJ97_1310 [Georgenia soli]
MFDLIDGLPLHPLVVHAVVVLLPAAALGTIAIAVVPAWRRRYGELVGLVALLATALVPVATRTGEALMRRVGPPAGDHQALGGELLWFALPLLLLVWLLLLAERRAAAASPRPGLSPLPGSSPGPGAAARGVRAPAAHPRPGAAPGEPARRGGALVTVLAVLAVLAALAALFQVYRVGESGARAVWGQVPAVQTR